MRKVDAAFAESPEVGKRPLNIYQPPVPPPPKPPPEKPPPLELPPPPKPEELELARGAEIKVLVACWDMLPRLFTK
jgi:hypothetical protein